MQLGCEPEALPSVFYLEEEKKNCIRCALNAPLNWGNVGDVIINKNFPSLDATARASPPSSLGSGCSPGRSPARSPATSRICSRVHKCGAASLLIYGLEGGSM